MTASSRPLVARFDSLEWSSTPAGAREKRLAAGNLVLRLVEFPEDFHEPEPCLRGHVGYVVRGGGNLETTQGVEALREGAGFLLPDGSPHSLQPAPGGCVLLLAERTE